MNRTFYILALAASLAMPAFSSAIARDDTLLKSGDQVKQIEAEKSKMIREPIGAGRSATEAATPHSSVPLTDDKAAKKTLEGVDPAVK